MERIVKIEKRVLTHGIFYILLLSLLFSCSSSDGDTSQEERISIEATVVERNTYGNLLLDLTPDSLKKKGFEVGDIVTVSGGDLPGDLEMPITDDMLVVGNYGMCITCFPGETIMTLALANASFSDRVGGKGRRLYCHYIKGERWI